MRLKKYKLENKEQIRSLFAEYSWPIPEDDRFFSKNHFTVWDKETLIGFGGIHLFDNGVAGRLGFIVVSKQRPSEIRAVVLEKIMKKIYDLCERKRVHHIEYSTTNQVMVSKLVKLGMEVNANGNAFMLYKNWKDVEFGKEN